MKIGNYVFKRTNWQAILIAQICLVVSTFAVAGSDGGAGNKPDSKRHCEASIRENVRPLTRAAGNAGNRIALCGAGGTTVIGGGVGRGTGSN